MGKKNKKSKNKKANLAGMVSGAAVAGVATKLITDVLEHIIADGIDNYLSKNGRKKKVKRMLKKLTSLQPS
jgi:hypothetical protein